MRCGGRLKVVASIEEPELIERILARRRQSGFAAGGVVAESMASRVFGAASGGKRSRCADALTTCLASTARTNAGDVPAVWPP